MKQTIKHLTNNLYFNLLFPYCILGAISLVIWFAGPLVSISDHVPFQDPDKRFYTILLIFVSWILKITVLDKSTVEKEPLAIDPPEFTKKLDFLTGRFQGAINFLNTTLLNKNDKNRSLINLPWYLLIGPSGSGKTSLLANSNIHFILAKQFKQEAMKIIPPTDVCDWWVTRDSVLVDVPGFYLYSKLKNAIHASQQTIQKFSLYAGLWQKFLNLMNQSRGANALSGVIIAISLSDLMNPQSKRKARIFYDIKNRIAELREKFGPDLPFYLTITKCDLLPGFLEYYSDIGVDELSQAWGITIPTVKDNQALIETFSDRFNSLIKRMNKQIIWRLHQERNPLIRPFIKDFPLQIELLKNNIASLLKSLSTPEKEFHLQGVYLTSAMQHAEQVYKESSIDHNVEVAKTTAIQILRNPLMRSRAYFIRQFLSQAIMSSASYHASTPVWQHRPKMYAASIGVIIVTALFLANELYRGTHQTDAIRDSLTLYQAGVKRHDAELSKALPLLNALEKTATAPTQNTLFSGEQTQQNANAAYQQALQTIIVPEIKKDLEKYLQGNNTKTPERIYAALQAYLMLADKDHLQPDMIASTLILVAPAVISQQGADQIIQHIRAAFEGNWQTQDLNPVIISQARKQLTSLTPVQLSLVILKNMASNNMDTVISLGTDQGTQPALINKQIANQVPYMFTGDAFQLVYDQQIDTAAKEATQSNWVLGNVSLNPSDGTALANQLRTLYVSNYVDIWESILANIQLATPTDLAQVDTLIANLIGTNSPLLQLLKTIKLNTNFAPVLTASPKLAALSGLLVNADNQQSDTLYKIFFSLQQTHQFLQNILTASDVNAAAFQAASLRVKNAPSNLTKDELSGLFAIANQSPEPVRSWLTQLAAASWHFLLQNAGLYVENQWRSTILPTYHTQFVNRFPFTPDATQEVAMEQFNQFLGARGALTQFYNSYIDPFVETTDQTAHWKKLDNEKIPFSQVALDQLQQAVQLQHLFFPHGENQVALKFTLKPVLLSPNTKSVRLSINGQAIEHDRSMPQIPQYLTWPGTSPMHQTQLSLGTWQNMPLNNTLSGDWGWLRLVSQATPRIFSQKEVLLHFNVDKHMAKYLLFTQGDVNPFLVNNIRQFKLPEQLT